MSRICHSVRKPGALRQLLSSLLSRGPAALSPGQDALNELAKSVEPVEHAQSRFNLWIEPDSKKTRVQTLLRRRRIKEGVFVIGRRISVLDNGGAGAPDFQIAQHEPYTVSKRHCAIESTNKGVRVLDLGSRLGTLVNGIRIGGPSAKRMEILLEAGEHCLIVGPPNSGHRFRLTIL